MFSRERLSAIHCVWLSRTCGKNCASFCVSGSSTIEKSGGETLERGGNQRLKATRRGRKLRSKTNAADAQLPPEPGKCDECDIAPKLEVHCAYMHPSNGAPEEPGAGETPDYKRA